MQSRWVRLFSGGVVGRSGGELPGGRPIALVAALVGEGSSRRADRSKPASLLIFLVKQPAPVYWGELSSIKRTEPMEMSFSF